MIDLFGLACGGLWFDLQSSTNVLPIRQQPGLEVELRRMRPVAWITRGRLGEVSDRLCCVSKLPTPQLRTNIDERNDTQCLDIFQIPLHRSPQLVFAKHLGPELNRL